MPIMTLEQLEELQEKAWDAGNEAGYRRGYREGSEDTELRLLVDVPEEYTGQDEAPFYPDEDPEEWMMNISPSDTPMLDKLKKQQEYEELCAKLGNTPLDQSKEEPRMSPAEERRTWVMNLVSVWVQQGWIKPTDALGQARLINDFLAGAKENVKSDDEDNVVSMSKYAGGTA